MEKRKRGDATPPIAMIGLLLGLLAIMFMFGSTIWLLFLTPIIVFGFLNYTISGHFWTKLGLILVTCGYPLLAWWGGQGQPLSLSNIVYAIELGLIVWMFVSDEVAQRRGQGSTTKRKRGLDAPLAIPVLEPGGDVTGDEDDDPVWPGWREEAEQVIRQAQRGGHDGKA